MKDNVANVLPEDLAVIASEKSSAHDDLKVTIFAQAAMSRSEKYATIQHLDLRDTKPTDLQMAIDKYVRGWFDEDLVKGVFRAKLSSDVRRLLRMNLPSTPVSKLARMADLWVTGSDDAPAIARKHNTPSDKDTVEHLRHDIEQLKCDRATEN